MDNFKKFMQSLKLTLAMAPPFLGLYVLAWEHWQPRQEIPQARIVFAEGYEVKTDMPRTYRGHKIYIEGINTPIDVPVSEGPKKIKRGASVDIIVKKCFPLPFLPEQLEGSILNIYE